MKLSIIIVSFNTKNLTVDCIRSIFANPPKSKFEVIVIDNNSDDGSVEEIKKHYKNKLALIENHSNVGFSRANNQGIKVSKGEHVLLLNSDTYFEDNSLQRLINIADNSDYSVIGIRLLNGDHTIQPSCFNIPTTTRAIKHYVFGKNILSKYYPEGEGLLEVESVVGAAMLIRRSVIDKIGYLDERFFFYYEDLEYCKRVRNHKLKVYYFPKAFVIHLHGSSGKGKTSPYLIQSSKIFHGLVEHFAINFIIKVSQVIKRIK